MIATETIKLALRNVLRNRRRSLITGAAVALGVIAVLFTQAYIRGLSMLIEDAVTEAGHGAFQVQRRGYAASQEAASLDLDLPDDLATRARILAVPGVRAVAPRLKFTGMISNGQGSTGFAGLGIDPATEPVVCPRGPGGHEPISAGGWQTQGPGFTTGLEDAVVLGQALADGLHIKLGDTVTLLARTPAGAMEAMDATVTGFFHSYDPMDDKRILAIPLPMAQRLLHMPGRISGYTVAMHRDHPLDVTAAAAEGALAGMSPPMEVRTWRQLAPYYRDVMVMQDRVLAVVIVIVSILVLAGIINTTLMSVFERTREIGTLMSIGFRRARILVLFLIESIALASLAGAIGAGIGALLIAYAHQRGLPFYVPTIGTILNRPFLEPWFGGVVLAGTLVGSAIGGLYPAYRASQLRPIEALHAT